MIAIIRIKGMVNIRGEVEETLSRLRLRRKYACVLVEDSAILQGMLKRIKDFVSYGEISEETLTKLLEARAKPVDKTKPMKLELVKKGDYEKANVKPFFRLHPARGGIDSKVHFPRGVLGNNKEKINDLILRML